MFGIDYPPYSTRLEMLDEGAQVVKALWSGRPVTFQGKHYQLDSAETHPQPLQSSPVIIMGGKGTKTLQIVAKHATEWNCSYVGVDVFRQKSNELDENCRKIGRDPSTLRRSLMIPFVIGKDEKALQQRLDAQRATFPTLPSTHAEWLSAGFLGGTPAQMIDQMSIFVEAGIQRFMLQHNALDDLDSLAQLSDELLPHFRPVKSHGSSLAN